ncbi:GNAT family N-acetyltransferase [Streptococcus sp. E29BA]|uniref:GNAT family N-acetyltransferase n=1 Tax=Streptococcus sp. E29BA TaxID=3278716 RepID=UPI00359E79F4
MLRCLHDKDVSQLSIINKLALGYSFSEEKTAQQLTKLSADDHHFLLGYGDPETGEFLGYVHAQIYESLYSPTGFNVLALAVHPEHQGKGIGRCLIAGLEDEAKARGYAFIRLNSASHRLEAHGFYRRIGYDGDKTQLRFIKLFEEGNDD